MNTQGWLRVFTIVKTVISVLAEVLTRVPLGLRRRVNDNDIITKA